MTRLSHLGFLKVSGGDAREFLQNLTSNDLRHLDERTAQYNSLCSPKGRMLASFLLFRLDGDYILQLPQEMVEAVRKRLSMYILRAKVTISVAPLTAVGISGQTFPASVPQSVMGMERIDSGMAIRLSDTRAEIVADAETIDPIIDQYDAVEVDRPYWERLEILEGIPVILPETEGHFVPQMVNFELIGGVSFQKGCYPGQEIVTRTHFLGKVKRRMVLAHVDSEISPVPGEEVMNGEDATGNVARAAPSPEGGFDILGVIHIEHKDNELRLKSGPVLHLMQLPYTLP